MAANDEPTHQPTCALCEQPVDGVRYADRNGDGIPDPINTPCNHVYAGLRFSA